MKFIKKIYLLSLALIISSGSVLYAKNYSDYLQDAKKYESQKKWAHALNSYFCALKCDEPVENKEEAFNGYSKLKNTIIEDKNPGYGNFDEFEWHDEWLKLKQETISTYFDDFKINIQCYGISRKLNYETKTADYSLKLGLSDFSVNHAFYLISELIRRNNYFSEREIYFGNLIQRGNPKDYKFKSDDGCYSVYTSYEDAVYYPFSNQNVTDNGGPAWLMSDFISIEVNVVDENGKEIMPSVILKNRQDWESNNATYDFNNVPSAVMKLIDERKAFFNVKAAYKNYGNEWEETEKINSENIYISKGEVYKGEPVSDEEILYPVSAQQRYKDYILLNKNFSNAVSYFSIKQMEFVQPAEEQWKTISKNPVTPELYKNIMNEEFKAKNGKMEALCNKLSMALNFVPVYNQNKITDPAEWKRDSYTGGFANIKEDKEANGFRYSSVKENPDKKSSPVHYYIYSSNIELKAKIEEENKKAKAEDAINKFINSLCFETINISKISYSKSDDKFVTSLSPCNIKMAFCSQVSKETKKALEEKKYSVETIEVKEFGSSENFYKTYSIVYPTNADSYYGKYRNIVNFFNYMNNYENIVDAKNAYIDYTFNSDAEKKLADGNNYRKARVANGSRTVNFYPEDIETFMKRFKKDFGEDFMEEKDLKKLQKLGKKYKIRGWYED